MTLKLKEKNIDDYFHNISQPTNIIRKSFQMEQQDILMPDGNPNTHGITNLIAPIIKEVIQNK